MADLLEQSGANRPKPGLITTPTSTISPEEMVRPQIEAAQGLRGLGKALDELSDRLDIASVPEAQAAGLAAVGRDEKGNPTVQLRPFALSRSDAAFNAAARQGVLSQSQMDAQRGLQEIAHKHQNDPESFAAEARSYVKGLGAGSREMRPLIQADAEKLANQHFLSLTNRKVEQTQKNALTAVTTQIQDSVNTIYALARQGGTATPEFTEAYERVTGLYKQLEENPSYGFPAERVRSELDRIKSQASGESMVGEVDRTYNRQGKAAAQKYLIDNIVNNPKLSLSNSERSQLYSSGLARLQYLDGETKAQVAAHRNVVSTIVEGLKSKVNIPDAQIDEAIATATKLGDAESVLKLNASRSVAALRKAGAGLTDEQEVRLFAGIGSGRPAPAAGSGTVESRIYTRLLQGGLSPVMAFGLMGNLSMESSFNTGARNPGDGRDGSDSIGIAQWNSDRARALSAFAASRGKPVTDVETQADFIIHELNTTEGRARAALASARTPEEAGRAAIGYFRPAGFSWANPDGAHNSGKRIEQARVLAATLGGASPEAAQAAAKSPFTPAQLQANPFLGSAWIQAQVADQKEVVDSATKVAQAISSGIDKGVVPDTQTLAAFLQTAEQFPDQLSRVRDELVAKVQGYDDAWAALGQPSSAGREAVRTAQARAQGAPILVQQRAEAMKEAYDRGVKALKETPWEEAARRGWSPGALPALDFTSADSFAAGLAARSGVATSISARTGEAQSVLSPTDTADLQAVWRNGTAEQRVMVAQQIGQLPDEQFRLVIEDSEVRDSLIGMSRSGDATKMAPAFALMDRAQRLDPDGFNKTYGRAIENRLAAWTSRMAYMSPEELAREATRENDPAMKKVRDELRGQAEERVKKLSAGEIAGYFDASWLPFSSPDAPLRAEDSARFAADYKAEFASTFADVGDEAKARELTVQRLGRVWAPSAVNGGRLTKFAPEKSPAYPPINGSHDWLKKQFDESVRAVLGDMGAAPVDVTGRTATVEVPGATAMLSAPRMLVPDARTEAEFNSGRPPSYAVVVQAPNGMFLPLQNAQGRQARFTADPEAALTGDRARALETFGGMEAARDSQERFDADIRRRADERRARRRQP